MKLIPLFISLSCLLFLTSQAAAEPADPQLFGLIQDLQRQMLELKGTIERQNGRILDLENRAPIQKEGAAGGSGPGSTSGTDADFQNKLSEALGGSQMWLKNLSLKGDFRLRYEAFNFKSRHPAETDDRNRFRYRLRYGLEKKFSDEMKIGFSFASGESVSGVQADPSTTNTSFDNNFNFKDIFVDRAYAMYSPAWASAWVVDKVKLTAGKMDNPFERASSELLWDRDVKPEGAAEQLEFKTIDTERIDLKPFVTAGQYVLDEDAATGGDAELFAYQLGATTAITTPWTEKPLEWTSAVSLFSYNDYAVESNFLIGTTSLARGNTNADGIAAELDAQDFEIFEYYNEISFETRGIPIRPYFDFAHNIENQATGDEGAAWSIGTKLGKVEKKGSWEIGYAYRRLEPESVVGAFTDSDFGLGGAGKRGSIVKLAYALTDNLQVNLGASLVNNLTANTNSVRDEAQRRFQLDLLWKF